MVQPRRGPLRDGRLMFSPHSLARALDGLDARGRRAAALNQKLYGAALAVPMGLTTRVSARTADGSPTSWPRSVARAARTSVVARPVTEPVEPEP